MTSEQALIDAVLANPDDSTARLIYADWLDEHGDVRGEYIRIRYEMVALKPRSKRYRELKTRLEPLVAQIDPQWLMRLGFVVRDSYQRDANLVAFGLLNDQQYGSEKKALQALSKRQAYLGFSQEDVERDFYEAIAMQHDIMQFKAELRERGQLDFNAIGQAVAFLRHRHPDAHEHTIDCALGTHITSWH